MQYRLQKLSQARPTRAQLHQAGIRLAKALLAEVGNVPPDSIQIAYTAHGKPYTDTVPLHFSISHTANCVLCAVHTAPIGADIEKPRLPHTHTIKRVCTADEITFIDRNPTRFAQVWTRKEAYAKLTGKGIGMGLANVCTADANALLPAVNGCAVRTLTEQDTVCSIIWQED